jgi:acetyl-CoA acetyltransferase
MPKVSEEVVIVGVGETRVGKLPGLQSTQIQAWAVQEALADCGLRTTDVDGLINLDPYATPNSMFASTLAEYLGLRTRFQATVDVGGTVSGMTMLQQAIWAIEAGHCEVAVCVYGENTLTGRPQDRQGLVMNNLLGGEEWEEPFGVRGLLIPYALVAQRYLDKYGASPDDLGEAAVVTRRHALLNDNAQMKKPLTLDEHRASRMISSPLRLFDCSLVSDGGGALVVTSRARARKLGLKGVRISSLAMRGTHNSAAQMPDIDGFGMAEAGRDAFESAGIGVQDLQVALLHDAFTISVLVTLEALGFCGPGEAGNYLRSGAASLGGRCPMNPHGGLLSQAHIGGMLHVTEAVHQLRGSAGCRQVPGVRHAVVSGNGGVFSVCGVMVMEAQA